MAIKKTASKAAASKKAAPSKKKVVTKTKAAPAINKKSDLQQQLEALHAQMEALNQEAVGELKVKISDTKKILRGYELQLEELAGKTTRKLKGKR